MKILCTICARGGSKGVPGKNIKQINGKPLIAYSVDQAKKWGKFDKIIVSTDDEEIAEVAKTYGAEVPFLRPSDLAGDKAGKIPAIQHAVDFLEKKGEDFDVIIDLDATAPLRSVKDIENCYNILVENNASNVYSVCDSHKNPYFNMVELRENGSPKICKSLEAGIVLSRQSAPKVYDMNASIYVYKRDFLMNFQTLHTENSRIYVMDEDKSVDIDKPIDFLFVEYMIKEGCVEID